MITLSSTYDKLKAEFESLQADHTKLQAEFNALKQASTVNPETIAAVEQLTKDFEASKASVTQLTDANAELLKQVENLKVDNKNFEEMVAAKAIEIVSAQGVPPLSTKPSAQPSSSNLDLVSQYNAIQDPQKQREFWVEHREELVKHLKK